MSPGRPLAGKTVVVTRPENRAQSISGKLRSLGATVIAAPAIRIEPPSDPRPLDEALDRIGSYDFVLFTSANGVEAFFGRWSARHPQKELPPVRFAAVGPATAASLAERGCAPEIVPERYTAEEVGRSLQASAGLAGKRFLLPRADIARETLVELLEPEGAIIDSVEAYRTVPNPEGVRRAAELVGEGKADAVTFTSASTVRTFFAALDREARGRIVAASIGPVTSSALREQGVEPAVEAETSTTDGLVDALVRYLRSPRET